MARMQNSELNAIFLRTRKRAERFSDEQLVDTFVNAGLLFEALSNEDHQILFGRRGTGKTHALRYLSERILEQGEIPIYVDVLRLGSDVSIYNDQNLPTPERAVRLLRDVLNEIHDALLARLIDSPSINLDRLPSLLDQFAQAMPSIEITGVVERENTVGQEATKKAAVGGVLSAPAPSLNVSTEFTSKATTGTRDKETGTKKLSVRFPDISSCITAISELMPGRRIWILIDEWSSLPEDIQPFLADMLRKSFFNVRAITVKIAAIEHRSKFYISGHGGQYTGFELGADIGSGINLDDYLVFDNDEDRSTGFFADLFFRHMTSIANEKGLVGPETPQELIRNAFTQDRAFQQLVRASEGVPRDAIHILANAAQRANNKQISIPNIRQAARVSTRLTNLTSLRLHLFSISFFSM